MRPDIKEVILFYESVVKQAMENQEKEYSGLEMLYASHVIQGKRTIESVPASIRPNVQEIVDAAISK